MANYQSIPQRFNKPTSNINHAYIDAALKDKQNTIDTNFGILQQTVENVLGQDLIREDDRNDLKEKVKGVLNTLDNTDSIKFDSKKSKFFIQDALSKAAKDPEVLKQLSNTKKVRDVQNFYKERLKKGNLNQQNFQYAYQKSGINSYLEGTSNDVGDFSYLEYVDVDAKLDEAARKLKAGNPNEKVSIQDPVTGEIISKKVSLITPEEMSNYLKVQLNTNDLKQLEIDGSMMYGMSDKDAIQYRDEIIFQNNEKYNSQVSLLEKYIKKGGKTKGEIADIKRQIQVLGQEKTAFERSLIEKTTAEEINGQQLLKNKIDFFSNLYTKNGPESLSYDKDSLKRMRNANADFNIKNRKISPEISTITTPTGLPDEINPYNDSLKRIDKTLRENSKYLQDQFNLLDEDQKELIQDTISQIKNDPEFLTVYKGQNISNETLQLEVLNRLGANFFPPDVAKELRSRISSTKSIQKSIDNTTSKFVKTQVLNKDVYEQLFLEESNLTMVTLKGDVNIQDFLFQNGVRDKESYESFIGGNSKEAKQLRATIALQSMSLTTDNFLSDVEVSDDPFDNIRQSFRQIGSTDNIDLTESEYRILRQSAHDLTEESLEETYDVSKVGDKYKLSLKNQNTNLHRIINRTNDLYQLGRTSSFGDAVMETMGFDIDRTVRNESKIRGLFDESKYQRFAENNSDLLDKTVVGSNSIRVKGDMKKQVGPLYEEVLQYVDNATFDKTLPIDIYRRETGELVITQIVQDEDALNNKEASKKRKVRQGVVQANDVKKMNIFNSQIDLLRKENSFKSLDDLSDSVIKMTFIGNDRKQIEGLNNLYDRNNKGENRFRLLSTEQTARDLIFNSSIEPYLSNSNEGLNIKQQFEDFVTNTHNYKLDFDKGLDTDYQITIKNKDDEEVGVIPLNRNIPVETLEKVLYGTPQAFLSLYSKSRVDKYINSIISR